MYINLRQKALCTAIFTHTTTYSTYLELLPQLVEPGHNELKQGHLGSDQHTVFVADHQPVVPVLVVQAHVLEGQIACVGSHALGPIVSPSLSA